jgi:DNA-binding HxlR family transcriptional regulator
MAREQKRGYGQYCALAKALDVVGDRWTMLIVRELLLRGPCRYSDLLVGLPGIATNLLAARLRELEAAGITVREREPPPVATVLIRLTPRGEELRDVVHAIGRWGAALLKDAAPTDAFRSHWIAMPIELHLVDRTPGRKPVAIEVNAGDESVVVETVNGRVRARPGTCDAPDAVVSGRPQVVVAALTGRLTLAEARRRGLRVRGSLKALERVRPPRLTLLSTPASDRRAPRATRGRSTQPSPRRAASR